MDGQDPGQAPPEPQEPAPTPSTTMAAPPDAAVVPTPAPPAEPQAQEDTPMTGAPNLDGPSDAPPSSDPANSNTNVFYPHLPLCDPYPSAYMHLQNPPPPTSYSGGIQNRNTSHFHPVQYPVQSQNTTQSHPMQFHNPTQFQQLTRPYYLQNANSAIPNGLPVQANLSGSMTGQTLNAMAPTTTPATAMGVNGYGTPQTNGFPAHSPYGASSTTATRPVQAHTQPGQQSFQVPPSQPLQQSQTTTPSVQTPSLGTFAAPATPSHIPPNSTTTATTNAVIPRGGTPQSQAVSANVTQAAPIIPSVNGAHGSPTRRYINQKVTPALLEGMKILAVREPERPLEWLGEFLLRRSRELEGEGVIDGAGE
ncbi:MAG: hypothetical protein Q9159_000059 [Coniocarpon cinnabarinum]